MSGAGRLFQVGCSFSFPEASTAALINMAIGGTKAVLQLKESLESLWMLPVGEEAAAGQAGSCQDWSVGVFKCLLQYL